MMRRVATMGVGLLLAALAPLPVQAQYELALRPASTASPSVLAVVDAGAVRSGVAPNPFKYDCVAFLQVRDASDSPMRLVRSGSRAWTPEVISIYPAGDPSRAQSPALMDIVGPMGESLVVALTPEHSDVEYIVRVSSAGIATQDRSDTVTVTELRSEPFAIPEEQLAKCGRVPSFDVKVFGPSEGGSGFNIAADILQRQAINRSRGGMWELFAEGSIATADTMVLLNAMSAGARVDMKLTSGWEHWVSVGLVGRLEATEDADVVDRVIGATARIRLDFLGIDEYLRPFLRQFTPYPMLTLEYNNVARWKGEGEPEIAGRSSSENRLRADVAWAVPLILNTTVTMEYRADYFLSDLPDGGKRFRAVRDISVEYPLNASGDLVAVVSWLKGETAPTFGSISEVLLGLGIRR
ncbi:hypothetical protein ACGF5M_02770 [Gemmatimonadota bacterium]